MLLTVNSGCISLSEPPELSRGGPATEWGRHKQGLEESLLTGRTRESKAGRTRSMDEKPSRQTRKMRAELKRKLWGCQPSGGPAQPPAPA